MNHSAFIAAAYAVALLATAALLAWAYVSMRSAERAAAELKSDR
jgi:hypothetical protein